MGTSPPIHHMRERLRDACSHHPPKWRKKTIQTRRMARDEVPRMINRQERSRVQHHQSKTVDTAYAALVHTNHQRGRKRD